MQTNIPPNNRWSIGNAWRDGLEGLKHIRKGCLVILALAIAGVSAMIVIAYSLWDLSPDGAEPPPPNLLVSPTSITTGLVAAPSATPIITAPTATFTPAPPTLTPTSTSTATSTATPTPLPAPKVANLIVGQRGIAGGAALTVTNVRITNSTVIVNYLIENLTANALPLALQNFGLTFATNLYSVHGLDGGTIFKTNSLAGNSQIDGRVVFSYGGVTSGFVFTYVEGRTNGGQFFVNLGR